MLDSVRAGIISESPDPAEGRCGSLVDITSVGERVRSCEESASSQLEG